MSAPEEPRNSFIDLVVAVVVLGVLALASVGSGLFSHLAVQLFRFGWGLAW